MPYKTNRDLPAAVGMLPDAAKTLWREAYNGAHEEYGGDEQKCAQTAWAAVKAKYVKKAGRWRARPEAREAIEMQTTEAVMVLAESDVVWAEAAEPEWLAEEDLEEADAPHRLVATLIRSGDNKGGTRRYTPEFLQRCVAEGRFSGAYGYANHPSFSEARERPERDMRYLAARTGEAYWDAQSASVKAPLVWLAEEHPASMGGLCSALFTDPIVRQRSGLSIYYQGPVQVQEADHPTRTGRKIQVPVALGDDRKFDVDIVTAPGAGGSLPMLEAARPEPEEVNTMTLEELKAQCPDLVAQLREEWEAETPTTAETEQEPVADEAMSEDDTAAATEPETAQDDVPMNEPPVTEAEAPKADGDSTAAIAELREEVMRLKSDRMLDRALAAEPVDEAIRAAVRVQLAEAVFVDEAAFADKFRATVDVVREAVSKAAGPRVADLGGTPPAEGQRVTFRDLMQKEAK